MPEEFFTEWEKYEENSWLSQMIPRACEVFDNICFYKEFGNRLNSEESIRSYGCILMGYISMDLEYFCLANRQKITNYFPRDIFKEQPTGAVIDGGGYDGDTAAEFFMMYPKYKGDYYLVEPGNENINRAKRNLKNMNGVIYIEGALGERMNDEIYISGQGQSISVTNSSLGVSNKVDCYSIDGLTDKKIGFIKMDIEGAELKALQGGKKCIADNKPNMAICAYHKPDDIRVLSEAILRIRNDYKIDIRHYGDKFKDCVLYFS